MTQMTLDKAMEMALQFHQAGRSQEAMAIYGQIVAARLEHPDALFMVGGLAFQLGQIDEAVEMIGRAIAIKPALPHYHSSLGRVLMAAGRGDEAIAAYQRALSIKPNDADAMNGMGSTLQYNGRHAEAIATFRRVLAIAADNPTAHYNLGLSLLLQGDFVQGWAEYEWRLHPQNRVAFPKNIPRPRWDGGELKGKRILLHAEQGLGDTIQFVRYVSLVAGRGGKIIVGCQPELVGLLTGLEGIARVVTEGDPVSQFDLHCPLLSLPSVFKTTVETIPSQVPYLRVDEEKSRRWGKRVAERGGGFKVGLVWAGRPTHPNDRSRSMTLATLAGLAQVHGVSFISLQKGEAGKQIHIAPLGKSMTDWTEDLKDFADTAALIQHMDLVVTVDTAVAHLAGALGKPVWVLLPFIPDWRWMLNRNDSPWYPTMRLFRQPQAGDWDTPVRKVVEAMRAVVG